MLSGLVKSIKEYKYILKKLTLLIITFCLSLSMKGCIRCKVESYKTQNYMNAVVNDITENSLNVDPVENENINSDKNIIDANSVIVDLNNISIDNLPKINKGDKIRIVYNGESVEEDPLKIETVFAIYLLDKSGEVIPNK